MWFSGYMEKIFLVLKFRIICESVEDAIQLLKTATNLDFQKEKIAIDEDSFIDSHEQKKYIISVQVTKQTHIAKTMDYIMSQLSHETIQLLLEQLEQRIDDELHFYMRFCASQLEQKKFIITQSGNCVHCDATIASYPKRKDVAIDTVKKYLNQVLLHKS